jgi:uncharacterized protein (DUF305 family)
MRRANLNARAYAAAVLTALTAACTAAATQTPPPAASPPPVTVTTTPAAIERARADSVRYPYTEADVHFMTMMIGHHAQAIKIAQWAPTHGAGAAVQRLAERVVNGQVDDIVVMQQWLVDRRRPAPGIDDVGQHMHMPGMLTEEQLKQLDAARGNEFDRLFLTFMIQHHQGAVAMVTQLFGTTGAAQDLTVFKFANDVQVDQSTEIARMQQMLANVPSNQRNP